MAMRITPEQTATAAPRTFPRLKVANDREDRVRQFEHLRRQSMVELQANTEELRSSGEVRLAKVQADAEAKLRQRGVLPSAAAYDLSGKTGTPKYVGRHIDLYA